MKNKYVSWMVEENGNEEITEITHEESLDYSLSGERDIIEDLLGLSKFEVSDLYDVEVDNDGYYTFTLFTTETKESPNRSSMISRSPLRE